MHHRRHLSVGNACPVHWGWGCWDSAAWRNDGNCRAAQLNILICNSDALQRPARWTAWRWTSTGTLTSAPELTDLDAGGRQAGRLLQLAASLNWYRNTRWQRSSVGPGPEGVDSFRFPISGAGRKRN